MVVKADQERVKTLISDTITLLCRNGLSFKTKFNINALIGITLDEDDVFLLDIRETIKNNVPELEDVDTLENSSVNQGPVSPSRRRKKRKRSHSNRESNGDQANSDSEGESVTKRLVKAEQEEEDSDDELVFIKDEPADESLQGSMYGGASNMYQNSQQHQQEQSGDILSSLAQQGQLYAMPTGSDGQPSGPSQWDPTTSQVPFSQAGQATPAGSQLNMSMGDSPAQDIKKLMCNKCGKFFIRMASFISHLSKVHGVHHEEKTEGKKGKRKRGSSEGGSKQENQEKENKGTAKSPKKSQKEKHVEEDVNEKEEGELDEGESVEDRKTCPRCPKFFSDNDYLRAHMSYVHADKGRRTSCPLCSKRFARADHMRRHLFTHFPSENVSCMHCDKNFSRRDHLKNHLSSVHGIASPPPQTPGRKPKKPKQRKSSLPPPQMLLLDGDVVVPSDGLAPMGALSPNAGGFSTPPPAGPSSQLPQASSADSIFPNPPMDGFVSMLQQTTEPQWHNGGQ